MTRRHFLSTLGRSVAVGALALPTVLETLATAQDAGPPRNANGSTVMRDGIPVSGTMPPQLQAIDDVIVGQMRRYGIPASVVAVSKDGVTVARRGYGYMDKQATKPTIPNAIMRLASLDKTPTATAIRLICEQGWELPRTNKPVTLELPVFPAMAESWGLEPPPGVTPDPRISRVTLTHILEHKSGLRGTDGGSEVVEALNLDRVPTQWDDARWIFGQQLERDPGAEFGYSNTGYGILKYFIEWLTGSYLGYLKSDVYGPAGTDELTISPARPRDRDKREPWYRSKVMGKSTLPEDNGEQVPLTDGGCNIDAMMLLATSAEAMCKYLSHWYPSTAKLLNDPQTGRLAAWNDNGGYGGGGAMTGSMAVAIQRRHAGSAVAYLSNSGDETGTGGKYDPMSGITKVLESVGW